MCKEKWCVCVQPVQVLGTGVVGVRLISWCCKSQTKVKTSTRAAPNSHFPACDWPEPHSRDLCALQRDERSFYLQRQRACLASERRRLGGITEVPPTAVVQSKNNFTLMGGIDNLKLLILRGGTTVHSEQRVRGDEKTKVNWPTGYATPRVSGERTLHRQN